MSRKFTPFNRLAVEIYDSGTTLLNDPDLDQKLATIENFRKQYPGGIYADASFYVPRPVLRYWLVKGAQRVIFRNGHEAAYEGWINDLAYTLGESAQGVRVPLVNGVEQFLMNWTLRKPWADQRIDESVLKWDTTAQGAAKFTIDRNAQIMFIPKAEAMALNDRCKVKYTAPTGQTVKRVTFNYDLQEGGQSWELGLANSVFTSLVSVTSSGTGSTDHTLVTPDQTIQLYYISRAAQTPSSDGTYYGKFTNITIYTETGSINMEEIAKDLRAFVTDLNSDEQYIAAAGTARLLVPYIVTGHMSVADILSEVIGFGDGVSPPNRWAWGLYCSEKAGTPDGKPVLFLEQYPDTSDYDYLIKFKGRNLVSDLELDRDYGAVRNWIPVRYTDANGREVWVTPDDDSSLKDDSSISTYGRRSLPGGLDAGSFDQTNAITYGMRYLNTYKAPPWKLLRPVEVRGYILDKQGIEVPASMIDPSKRVKIDGWPEDETGAGIIFVITGMDYRHGDETCAITTGGQMAPFMPRQLAVPFTGGGGEAEAALAMAGPESISVGGEEPERLNFYKRKPIQAWARRHGIKLTGPGQFGWRERHRIEKEARHERG